MHPISFKRRRFPPDVIRYAVRLYFRFTLSILDVEELLAQRGIEASRSTLPVPGRGASDVGGGDLGRPTSNLSGGLLQPAPVTVSKPPRRSEVLRT